MTRGVRFVLASLILALALAPTLSGCSAGQSTMRQVLKVLGAGEKPLPEEAVKQLQRFRTVYRAYSSAPDETERLEYFDFAYRRVRAGYVREIPDATLIDAAIKGVRETKAKPGTLTPKKLVEAALVSMVASLDPHSTFLNAEEFRETFVQTRGEFGGLGIEITMEEGLVKVIAPIEGTPAERAGIEAGDLAHRPVLDAFSGNVFHVGDRAGQGQAMKVLNNFLMATAMAATSEAVLYGLSQGLDMKTVLDVVNVSSGRNMATSDRFPKRVLTGTFDAGFQTGLLNKDVRLYIENVRAAGTPDAVGATVAQLWQKAADNAPDSDFSRIYEFIRDNTKDR